MPPGGESPISDGEPPAATTGAASGRPPAAAVLWAHGDAEWTADEHAQWRSTVYTFTALLRACGIDADLDLFHSHDPTDWARFGPSAIRANDFVVIVLSRTWRRAWDGELGPGESAGALGEANVLRSLYQDDPNAFLRRVIPVLLLGARTDSIPQQLRATTHWVRVPSLDEAGVEDLLRRLTGQPAFPKPPLGTLRVLPPTPPESPPRPRRQPGADAEPREAIAAQLDDTEQALLRLGGTSDDRAVARARKALAHRHASLLTQIKPAAHSFEATTTPVGPPEPAFVPTGSGLYFRLEDPAGPLRGSLRNGTDEPAEIEEAMLTTPLGTFTAGRFVVGHRPAAVTGAAHPPTVPPGERLVLEFGKKRLAALAETSALALRIVYRFVDGAQFEYKLELQRAGSTANGRPRWRGQNPAVTVLAGYASETQAGAAGASPPSDPDYLPESTLAWARTHRDLLDAVVDGLLRTGAWPSVSALSRGFARSGRPQPLRSILQDAPRGIGFVDAHPARVVLLLFGLRLATRGHVLLDGFIRMLRLATERYAADIETPVLRRSDLAVEKPALALAVGEIVLREAPFVGSGSGGPSDEWERAIDDGVVRYWQATSADDYLRIRATELGM